MSCADMSSAYMSYADYVKGQVSTPDWERVQRMSIDLSNNADWALLDFIKFEERWKTETPFLIEQLKGFSHPKILDACLGYGATTIGLKLAGIEDITSNEIGEEFREKAKETARTFGVELSLISQDWRNLDQSYHEAFDAVLCLGNSFTYLFKKEDQIKTLANFYRVLKPGGTLIIDERNYAEQILKGTFRHSGKVVYCGIDKVVPHPVFVSESMVIMEYHHLTKGKKAYYVLYPFKKGEMKSLLCEAGFGKMNVFGDYQSPFNPEDPEFITYAARK